MDNFKSPPPISARRTHSSSSAANPVAAVPVVPQRTTKTASKLVVFPPASPPLQPFAPSQPISIAKPPSASNMDVQSPGLDPSSHPELSSSVPEYPPAQPAEKPVSSHKSNPSGPRTEAEWISKESRNLLPRVTAYCAADAYDIKAIAAFLKTKHGVVGRVYDECLYISYEHRVAGGAAGYAALIQRHTARLLVPPASSSTLSASNLTETVKQEAEIHPRHSQTSAPPTTPIHANMPGLYANFPDTHLTDPHLTSPIVPTTESEDVIAEEEIALASSVETAEVNDAVGSLRRRHGGSTHGSGARLSALNNPPQIAGNYQSNTNPVQSNTLGVEKDYKWMGRNEVFLFDFGVIVLWNFTVEEENLYLSILKPFATSPRSLSDAEVEDFHFQYDFSRPNQPRIFNDMITLKSGNPMIKLTISHGMSQSVKLARFENIMEQEIAEYMALPKMMAKHGEVKLTRDDVMRVVGRLFRLRMDVNLVSNVLDTPEIFWSEDELQGLYNAIRGYLEISQRVKLLNSRTGVISDLLDMLSDHLHGSQMTMMTRIVIFLIVVTCIVASAEVYVKMLLERRF